MIDEEGLYKCQECTKRVKAIYAYLPTNQWLCFSCLKIGDRKYAKKIKVSEDEFKEYKEAQRALQIKLSTEKIILPYPRMV